ncbi:hypothetical protein J4558_04375 [Leptolyngbya sp. 15MV]|nr:hypothetical protein J4558_04375 [Leptolyngbya sp. 15MV]
MIRATLARFVEVLRDGFRIWCLAPVIPLLIVIPEALQHVAEVRIGMFESREVARALADDPRRMVWGYLKLAGLALAILASLRFWAAREQGLTWYSPRGVRWKALGLALMLILLTSLPELLLRSVLDPAILAYITLAIPLATLPLIAYLAGALIGDPNLNLRGVFRTGWWPTLRMVLFAAAAWVPLQWLHGQNHAWALGASDPVVWGLMAFDSLVVGLLATIAGTAFHHGYRLPRKEP